MNYRNSTFLTQFRASGHREVPKDPVSAAIVSAVGLTGAAATVATIAIQIGIAVAVSWAISALTPQPRAPSRRLMANLREAAGAQEYVYGKVRKGGVVTYVASSGGSSGHRNLYQIIVLAGHPVEEIGTLYVNDGVVTLDAQGNVQESRWSRRGGIRIFKFDGTQTTGPNFPNLPANFVGEGIAYLAVQLIATNGNTWRNGIPLITAEVKGKKVFDPRTGVTAWSDNAALCIRDYLVDERGMDDAGNIDEVTFSAAADVCDARNFKMNGVVNAENPTGNILQDMVTSCAGTLFWGGGKWRLKAGDYTFPVKTFTLDDLRSSISIQTRNSMRDSFNVVQGLFNDAEQRWIEASYPEYFEQEFITEDNNIRTELNFNLPLVTDADQARFLAALTLRRSREQITFSAEFGLEALEVEPGDIVNLDMSRYGWNNKEFEVVDWRLAPSSEAGDLRVAMTLREVSEAAFDPTLPAVQIISNRSELSDLNFVPAVGVNATVQQLILNEKVTNFIIVDVTSEDPDFTDRVEVQFREVGDEEFITVGTGNVGRFEIVDVELGNYDIRARAINNLGIRGEFTVLENFNISGKDTPPSDVTELFADLNNGSVTLDWEPVPDLDLSHYIIRHAIEEAGATFANATTAAIKVPRPASDITLPVKPGTYMIRSQDKSGNQSLDYTSVVVPADALDEFDNRFELDEDHSFSGTLDGVTVDTDALIITDTTTAPSSGEYMLDGFIDLTEPKKFRSRLDVTTLRQDEVTGLWDDIPGLFNSIPGNFDDWTGDVQFSDTDVKTFISITQDDPNGSPTWSDFKQFKSGNFFGRAARFMVRLKSTSPNVTPRVSRLTAIVEHN